MPGTTEVRGVRLPALDTGFACPSCGSDGMVPIYEQRDVPAHSCLLMDSPEEARNYPRGDLRLGFCPACAFISNLAFDVSLNDYSQRYEETQHCSLRFERFARDLARRLVRKYDLERREVLEIGCGKGEFLEMLVDEGARSGVGIDPGYHEDRLQSETARKRLRFIVDLYSEKYSGLQADFILCRHTLEHIRDTETFLRMIRRSIGDRQGVVVFFELPDVYRVLRECAFWDLYYEHCSYFSLGSLAGLFRRCGFDVTELWAEYDDQYLMLAAVPAKQPRAPRLAPERDLERMARAAAGFVEEYPRKIAQWRTQLRELVDQGRRVVVWGSGSKGVSYLTTLGVQHEVQYVVDINPRKHGKYMPGTGQRIVGPEFLVEYRPDDVVVMNPIYVEEISRRLGELGVEARLSACR